MIATWGVPTQRFVIGALVAIFLALHASAAFALILVTSDPTQVATFQSGATIENFDNLSALTITSYASGQTVPAGNQFSSRDTAVFTAPFFNSGGASFNDPVGNPGLPIGIFDPDGAIAGDVVSPNNVAGPLFKGSEPNDPIVAFSNGFMEVIFPADVQLVGLWIPHATAPITMNLKDSTNQNLTTGDFQVTGSGGQFIGIQRDTADVRGVTIGFTESFTIDDFTFGTSGATTVPEPASITLAALGLGFLVARRRLR